MFRLSKRSRVLSAVTFTVAVCLILAHRAIADDSPKGDDGAKASAAWGKKLNDWRTEHEKSKQGKKFTDPSALPQVADIDDPAAIKPLLAMFQREKDHNLKCRYVQALGNIGVRNIGEGKPLAADSPAAKELLAALVKISVEENAVQDTDPVRAEAIKQVGLLPNRRDAVPIYARYLGSKNVTRTAEAIMQTKIVAPIASYDKPDTVLTLALIKALVGTKKVPVNVWREGLWTGSKSPGNTWWHYEYRTGTKLVDVPDPNPAVQKALTHYTNQDFSYDVSKWREWYEKRIKMR